MLFSSSTNNFQVLHPSVTKTHWFRSSSHTLVINCLLPWSNLLIILCQVTLGMKRCFYLLFWGKRKFTPENVFLIIITYLNLHMISPLYSYSRINVLLLSKAQQSLKYNDICRMQFSGYQKDWNVHLKSQGHPTRI